MKELPYYRFTVSEWMNGDISMEDYETKGLFTDICAWYWFKDCSITQAMLDRKFNDHRSIQILYDSGILKLDGEKVCIEFLDEQFMMLTIDLENKRRAGRKGGKQRASNAKATLNRHSSYKDKDKDNNKDKDIVPDFLVFKEYALEKKPLVDLQALKLKYESWVESGWKDGNGNKIVKWKTKLLNTLPYLKERELKGTNLGDKYEPSPLPENWDPMPESLKNRIKKIGK